MNCKLNFIVLAFCACLIGCEKDGVDIVMIGDSMTEMGPWVEELGAVNLGVGGYRTAHLISPDFLDEYRSYNTRNVLVMVGINDAMNKIPVSEVIENYILLLEELEKSGAEVIIQSTIHQSHTKNKEFVDSLNRFLKSYCDTGKATYLDIDDFLSEGGALIKDYTTDGTHLTAEAYNIWLARLKELLDSQGHRP